MTSFKTNIRRLRIDKYIDRLRKLDIVSVINNLHQVELRELIEKSKNETKGKSEPQIIQQIIHNQLNITITKITDDELMFLKSQTSKITTYRAYITEYRKEIHTLLDKNYVRLQRQYKVRYYKLQNTINQQLLNIIELELAMTEIHNDAGLSSLKDNMDIIQQKNPTSKSAQIALFKMTAGKHIHQQITSQYKASKIKKQKKYRLIDQKKYIKIAEGLLYDNNNHHELILGLCALTGRRQIEVVKSGNFELYQDYSMMFTGQAKKRKEDQTGYVIPVLCSPTKIIKAHKKLKQLLPIVGINCAEDSNRSINNRLFTSSNSHLKQKIFESIYPSEASEKPLALRSIYAAVCYEIFDPNMSFRAYTAQILNHENMDSADSYDQYKTI